MDVFGRRSINDIKKWTEVDDRSDGQSLSEVAWSACATKMLMTDVGGVIVVTNVLPSTSQ